MTTSSSMPTPVTRSELREELGQLEQRFDGKLEHWGGALLARIEAGEQRMLARIEAGEQRMLTRIEDGEQRMLTRIEDGEQRTLARIEDGEQRMLADLARHARAIQEAVSTQISVIDDKYADLPARVRRFEATVVRRRPRGR